MRRDIMTAAAPQERLAKTTSWLAQLKGNAEWAGFTAEDAAQKAQERYGKPLDELTVSEAQTLAWEYSDISKQKAEAARAARNPQHGLHTPPTMLQNALFRARSKRARVHPEHYIY